MTTLSLGGLTEAEFLEEFWQKKPLLIRNAFPDFVSPLEPDELAGLACQEEVLSRLIMEKGGDYPWQLKHGPFDPGQFDALGDSHWTVLVQEVDRHVPQVSELFDAFSFLPNWRKDDVMISFAANDTGVGAHTDSYDVFLLQGSGRRRWQIGPVREDYKHVEGLDIRMIENFEPSETFDLETGDMLYLPPGVPHNGVSLEPCLTYSFGFLAPTQADIASSYLAWQAERGPSPRYGDPDLKAGRSPGLISSQDVDRVRALLEKIPTETEDLAEWLGGFMTRAQRLPADVEEFEGSYEEFLADFEQCEQWRRHEGVRVAGWCGEKVSLFVDGEKWAQPIAAATAQLLSEQRVLSFQELETSPEILHILYQFTRRGWGYLPQLEELEEEDL